VKTWKNLEMNIFVLDENPFVAAEMLCDKHVPKMCVESAQMMASALLRHNVSEFDMPLTKKGTPYKGGYKHHPCTVWAGDTSSNFNWLASHGISLCEQFFLRWGHPHGCTEPIIVMTSLASNIPAGELTSFAQAMPDELRDKCAVTAYRNYYRTKEFAAWEFFDPPHWW